MSDDAYTKMVSNMIPSIFDKFCSNISDMYICVYDTKSYTEADLNNIL